MESTGVYILIDSDHIENNININNNNICFVIAPANSVTILTFSPFKPLVHLITLHQADDFLESGKV